MATAQFHFHGRLAGLLPRELRHATIARPCARAATLKNAIEAMGVPHTEAARILVNGADATLARIVRDADEIDVFPWNGATGSQAIAEGGFVADAHLGGLARFLRMLGYDTLYDNGVDDAEIRCVAREERRVVLSRDRELLKCRDILRGCYVYALKPEDQLAEVAARFDLAAHARPFTLCLHCNRPLVPVAKMEVIDRLPPQVAEVQNEFTRCGTCDRIYWPGSHYERMQAVLARVLNANKSDK